VHKSQTGVQTLPAATAPSDAAQIVHLFLHVIATFRPAAGPLPVKVNKRA
jgi:hypothetical protein